MSAQTKPRCEDCGKVTDRCIRRHPHGVIAGSKFLCADCEYLRDHPDAKRGTEFPRKMRPVALQDEVLF